MGPEDEMEQDGGGARLSPSIQCVKGERERESLCMCVGRCGRGEDSLSPPPSS